MVIGLLTLAAIPTTTAVAFGVQEQKRENARASDEKLLRKFKLDCWCEGKGKAKDQVHNGRVVLGDGKVWIQANQTEPSIPFHTFRGFYVAYPDEERPKPAPIGLVSTISDDPPMLNWIYVDKQTWELKYGNRTQSRPHWVGSWKWTTGEDEGDDVDPDDEPGGLALDGDEKFVIIEPEKGNAKEGRWEIRWDGKDDGLKNVEGIRGRKVLRVSLERTFLEAKKEPENSKTDKT